MLSRANVYNNNNNNSHEMSKELPSGAESAVFDENI